MYGDDVKGEYCSIGGTSVSTLMSRNANSDVSVFSTSIQYAKRLPSKSNIGISLIIETESHVAVGGNDAGAFVAIVLTSSITVAIGSSVNLSAALVGVKDMALSVAIRAMAIIDFTMCFSCWHVLSKYIITTG
jgi:hypothetical protein